MENPICMGCPGSKNKNGEEAEYCDFTSEGVQWARSIGATPKDCPRWQPTSPSVSDYWFWRSGPPIGGHTRGPIGGGRR